MESWACLWFLFFGFFCIQVFVFLCSGLFGMVMSACSVEGFINKRHKGRTSIPEWWAPVCYSYCELASGLVRLRNCPGCLSCYLSLSRDFSLNLQDKGEKPFPQLTWDLMLPMRKKVIWESQSKVLGGRIKSFEIHNTKQPVPQSLYHLICPSCSCGNPNMLILLFSAFQGKPSHWKLPNHHIGQSISSLGSQHLRLCICTLRPVLFGVLCEVISCGLSVNSQSSWIYCFFFVVLENISSC